jgi:UDP-N-acetylmuramoyl-tripeptide--D-alanyl-D-alanine ligase
MRSRTTARVVTFGADSGADVRVCEPQLDELARPRFRLETPYGAVDVALRLHGMHHAFNAAAVAAAALTDGIELGDVASALERAGARSPHRMDVRTRADGLVVIDDSYNANPESTRAALDALARLGAGGRHTWAVLGEMRELGPDAESLHRQVGAYAAGCGVDEVVAVGAGEPIAAGASVVADWPGRARVAADVAAASSLLAAEARPGHVVLVKASNGAALWRVAEALLNGEPAGATA